MYTSPLDKSTPAYPAARFGIDGLCISHPSVRLCHLTTDGKYKIVRKTCPKCGTAGLMNDEVSGKVNHPHGYKKKSKVASKSRENPNALTAKRSEGRRIERHNSHGTHKTMKSSLGINSNDDTNEDITFVPAQAAPFSRLQQGGRHNQSMREDYNTSSCSSTYRRSRTTSPADKERGSTPRRYTDNRERDNYPTSSSINDNNKSTTKVTKSPKLETTPNALKQALRMKLKQTKHGMPSLPKLTEKLTGKALDTNITSVHDISDRAGELEDSLNRLNIVNGGRTSDDERQEKFRSSPFDGDGYCHQHPNIRLAKRTMLGSWKVMMHVCPECCHESCCKDTTAGSVCSRGSNRSGRRSRCSSNSRRNRSTSRSSPHRSSGRCSRASSIKSSDDGTATSTLSRRELDEIVDELSSLSAVPVHPAERVDVEQTRSAQYVKHTAQGVEKVTATKLPPPPRNPRRKTNRQSVRKSRFVEKKNPTVVGESFDTVSLLPPKEAFAETIDCTTKITSDDSICTLPTVASASPMSFNKISTSPAFSSAYFSRGNDNYHSGGISRKGIPSLPLYSRNDWRNESLDSFVKDENHEKFLHANAMKQQRYSKEVDEESVISELSGSADGVIWGC
jgi:hypothetical protein